MRYPFLAPWHIPASSEALPELHRVLPLPSTQHSTRLPLRGLCSDLAAARGACTPSCSSSGRLLLIHFGSCQPQVLPRDLRLLPALTVLPSSFPQVSEHHGGDPCSWSPPGLPAAVHKGSSCSHFHLPEQPSPSQMPSELPENSQEEESLSVHPFPGCWLTETQPSIPMDGPGAAPWGRGGILAPVIEMPTHRRVAARTCLLLAEGWRGCWGSRSPTAAPWEVPCSPLPPPPSCCSLTQAGAEGGRGICSSIAAFWHQSLCQNQRAFSKKTLNSFNRQLELLPHRSKGHELSVFIALGRFMSLFFKEGRERGKAVAYCLAWGAGREEQGGGWRRTVAGEVHDHDAAESPALPCPELVARWGGSRGLGLRARTKQPRLKPKAHRRRVAAPASQGLHAELPAGRERGDTGTCHIPSSLGATDGSSGGASPKAHTGGTGLLLSQPACPAAVCRVETLGGSSWGSQVAVQPRAQPRPRAALL